MMEPNDRPMTFGEREALFDTLDAFVAHHGARLAHFCRRHPRCTVAFDWRDRSHTVTYRPTPRMLREAGQFERWQDSGRWRAVAQLLSGCVVEWDVTRDGQPLPITEESVMGMVAGLSLTMMWAIMRDCTERLEAYARHLPSA